MALVLTRTEGEELCRSTALEVSSVRGLRDDVEKGLAGSGGEALSRLDGVVVVMSPLVWPGLEGRWHPPPPERRAVLGAVGMIGRAALADARQEEFRLAAVD